MDVLALLLRKQIAGILVAYHGTWKYFSKGILVKFKCLQKSTCLDAQNLSARSLAENYGVFSACSSHLKSYYGGAVKDEKKTPIKKKRPKTSSRVKSSNTQEQNSLQWYGMNL